MGWPLPDELTLHIFTCLPVNEPLDALLQVSQGFRRIALDSSLRNRTVSLEALADVKPDGLTGFHVHCHECRSDLWDQVAPSVSHVLVEGNISWLTAMHMARTVEVAMFHQVEYGTYDKVMSREERVSTLTCPLKEMILLVGKTGEQRPNLQLHGFPHLTRLITNACVHFQGRSKHKAQLERLTLLHPERWHELLPFLQTQTSTLRELSVKTEALSSEENLWTLPRQVQWMDDVDERPPFCFPQCETLTLFTMEAFSLNGFVQACPALRSLTMIPTLSQLDSTSRFFFQPSLPSTLEHLTVWDSHRLTSDQPNHRLHHGLVRLAKRWVAESLMSCALTIVAFPDDIDDWLNLGLPFESPVYLPNNRVAMRLTR